MVNQVCEAQSWKAQGTFDQGEPAEDCSRGSSSVSLGTYFGITPALNSLALRSFLREFQNQHLRTICPVTIYLFLHTACYVADTVLIAL